MKQKPKPIILGSILVVIVIGVLLTNTTDIWSKLAAPKEEAPKQPGTAQALSDKDKAQLAAAVSGGAKGRPNQVDPDDPNSGKPTTIPDEPSIVVQKPKYIKPNQNSTAISGQWYRDEANTKNMQADIEKRRGN